MSEKKITIENNLNQTYFCGKDFRSIDNSYINSFNDKEKRINNSYTQPSSNNYNIISNQNNNSLNNPPILNDDDYIKERYSIIKEENSELKKKLFNLEKGYKIKKGKMEEKILILRDEYSNLQLQIQKTIEKQKDAFKNNDDIFNINKTLLNDINKLKNEVNILKDSITRKNAEIEEKNKIINDLLEEKNVILEEEAMFKNQISNLEKDKEILINQKQDLNIAISDKIAPKLRQNENSLINLQAQIENLRMDNEKYKSDNTVLFNESKTQKN
jgi:chromosome segregation ATPase